MKKLMVSFLVAFMVFAIAGTAAAFSSGSLTAVIYNDGDNEVGLDLGNVASLDFTASNVELAAIGSFSLEDFNAISSFSDLSVGIFASTTGYNNYFATTEMTEPVARMSSYMSFKASATLVYGLYGDGVKANKLASHDLSYDYNMNSNSNAPGYYAGFNANSWEVGEAILSDDGFVDMYLYEYYGPNFVPGANGTAYKAMFRISSNGSIVMNPETASAPIPGAIILLGSGLLGLAGIRRKK